MLHENFYMRILICFLVTASMQITGNQGKNGIQGFQEAEGRKGDMIDEGTLGMQDDKGVKAGKGGNDEFRLALIENNLQQVQEEMIKMRFENKKLKEKLSNMMESETKIKHSFLPAGYGDYSLYDIQWQSLHMAAAGACRGSTGNQAGGPNDNFVVPRISGMNCEATCQYSERKICTGEVSIDGYMSKASITGKQVGTFYNYGCKTAKPWGVELDLENKKIIGGSGYISYCCCRN